MALPPDAPVDLKIRKALEGVLKAAVEGAGFQVEWPNLTFDRQAQLKASNGPGGFVEFSFHPTDERARTLGAFPRVEHTGFFRANIHVEPGLSEDVPDIIVGKLRAAFPYSIPIVKDGLSIEITRRQRGTGNPVDSWYYLPVSIYWTLWRES